MVPCHQRRAWRRMRNNWRRRRQIENDDRDVEYGQRRLHLHPWLPYRSAFGRVLLCFRYQLPPTTDPTPKLYSYFLTSTVPNRGHRENKNIILLHHNIDKINSTKTTFQNGSVKFVKNSMRITFAVKKKTSTRVCDDDDVASDIIHIILLFGVRRVCSSGSRSDVGKRRGIKKK